MKTYTFIANFRGGTYISRSNFNFVGQKNKINEKDNFSN
jgi:hypothetical protein